MADSSILAGVDELIDGALQIKGGKYKDRKTCKLLSKEKTLSLDGNTLIQRILSQIEKNWHGGKSRSNENWRWKQNPETVTKSEEVILERWIVRTTGKDWVNQVPVASGLTRCAGGRRAIDLVHRCPNGWYEFIELKVNEGGGTPLFAAMEILQYGVLYIFSRQHARELGYEGTDKELFGADGVHLKVLAPAAYYEGYSLSWLEESINSGLAKFLAQGERGFKMNFKFEALSRNPVTWKV